MSKVLMYAAIVALLLGSACSNRYGKPQADPASDLYAGGQYEQGVVVGEIVEFGKAFPFRYRPKGTGQMSISPDSITWKNNDDSSRSFSIRSAVVHSVTMQCVVRAGGNICLELVIETVTGLKYHFRDIDWAAGYNQRVTRLRDHMKQNFPRIVFSEKFVDEIR